MDVFGWRFLARLLAAFNIVWRLNLFTSAFMVAFTLPRQMSTIYYDIYILLETTWRVYQVKTAFLLVRATKADTTIHNALRESIQWCSVSVIFFFMDVLEHLFTSEIVGKDDGMILEIVAHALTSLFIMPKFLEELRQAIAMDFGAPVAA